jgi:hypothetical protein
MGIFDYYVPPRYRTSQKMSFPEGSASDRVYKAIMGMNQEQDPNGKAPNEPGAKLDAGKIKVGLMMRGFARALMEVANVTTYGAQKYTENGWTEVPDGVKRYTDAMMRHYLQEERGEVYDESGLPHAAQVAWNALARLELMLREEK